MMVTNDEGVVRAQEQRWQPRHAGLLAVGSAPRHIAHSAAQKAFRNP
jgi:hypothetical protein